MYHAVSPFHARKINDEFLQKENKKVYEFDDELNIHEWYNQIKQHMIPTLIIPLTRKEIEALKIYSTYWQIYKTHIIDNYDKIKQDPSSLDKFPKDLTSVIQMHFKKIQTPNNDDTKWGEKFNYSIIDGMTKHIDSIKSLQSKITHSISSFNHKQNESIYIIPKLSTDLLLPFDSIYESMNIFHLLHRLQKPQSDDGCDILRLFHDTVWKSLQYKPTDNDTYDILDIFFRSGLIVKQINLALLKFSDYDEDEENTNNEEKEESKQTENKERLSMVFQLYCIPDKLQHIESIMDTFLEFRMFITNDNGPNAITQMQTFLNIMSQDHIKKASKSFLIPLKRNTLYLWNGVLNEKKNDIDDKKKDEEEAKELKKEYYPYFEIFQGNIKRVLFDKYNNIKDDLVLNDVDNFCIDFVIIRQINNGFDIKIAKIHRLPIYPHEYGMYIWERDKEQILNTSTVSNENNWNVALMRPSSNSWMGFDDTNAVLSANVYSCIMDYFVKKKWIQNPNEKNDATRNGLKFCAIL